MADDKKNPDEYEYPSEEYYKGGEYIPPEDPDHPFQTESLSSSLPKRVMAIIGIIVAVIVVYFILLYINSKRQADTQQPAEVSTATIPQVSTAPVVQTTQPVAPAPALDDALQKVTQQNQANQQAITAMQSSMQQLQTQLNEITNSMTTLANQIQVIANEVRAIGIDSSLRGRQMGTTVRGTAYQLKALVPGRAWLQSRNGVITSVTLGDRLPGYGIIQMINTDQGIVTTSSGAIIEYGLRDS